MPWLLWGLCLAGLLPRVAAGQWGWGIAVFVAGALLQYWCIIAIHEAIHQYFVTRHRLNGLVALLCAFPIGLDRNYSWLHLDHHKHFPAADIDPDGPMYRDFPSSLTQWIRRLLLNASGLQVVFQVFEQRRQHAARPIRRHYFRHEWAWKLLVQLTLLVLFAVLGFAPGYVLFWLLPLVTLAKLLSFLRTFAEHAHPQYPGALRVFAKPSWLDHYLAYFGFLYHSEHHLRANVPYGDLPQRSLQDAATKPAGAVMIVVYDGGHLGWHCQLLKSLWRAARRDDGTQHRNIPNERVLYLPILPGADLHHRPVADS
ncbi:MAG: fatty acid desaturase family protein [Stenotrophobium sp.]